jgi:hypothetical protein
MNDAFNYIGILVLMLVMFFGGSCAQGKPSVKTYETSRYTVMYPNDWIVSNDGKIVNIYPKDNLGAVTISTYQGITFPLELTKELILETNGIVDSTDSVKMIDRGEFVEFSHEYLNKKTNARWLTRALRRGSDLFLITVNCDDRLWPERKRDFLSVIDSFKMKP